MFRSLGKKSFSIIKSYLTRQVSVAGGIQQEVGPLYRLLPPASWYVFKRQSE
uniref:Uncharacterized protein n=1 Tax=Roseihalotalea indica TaxID=2867963 RepID=A0AA49GJ87_9BACT|nr:hypothetical protein K4G66_22855 [Tunicatimonas sp. TK19036]